MLNGQGMHISGGLLGQCSVRDRDLRFTPAIAPANPPTQRCELAELDYGRGLKQGLFPIRGCHFQVCLLLRAPVGY